jgi:hypothetical protein
MDNIPFDLSETIAALRRELTMAMAEGSGEKIQFQLGPVELEIALDIKKSTSAGGGIKFWVASFEGKGQTTKETRHRIKLQLQPVSANRPNPGPLTIASELSQRPP